MSAHKHDPADPRLNDETWLRGHLRDEHGTVIPGHLRLAVLIAAHELTHPELPEVDRPGRAWIAASQMHEHPLGQQWTAADLRAHLATLHDVTLPASLNTEDLLTSHAGRHPNRNLTDPGAGRILVADCERG